MAAAGHRERRIRRLAGRAIGDFGMIQDGDRILLGLSGGKDSWTLLHILSKLRERAPVRFDLLPVTVHPGFPGFDTTGIEAYLKEQGYECRIVHAPIFETMQTKLAEGERPCSLCSRIRRGVLYTQARESGCAKVALGHHLDDFIETLLLNQFYNGKIKAMSPYLRADDGKSVVIRPLVYVPEQEIIRFAAEAGFPVTCCACPSCGDPDMKRMKIKGLLAALEQEQPGIKANLLSALGDVDMRHLLVRAAGTASGEVRPPLSRQADRREAPSGI